MKPCLYVLLQQINHYSIMVHIRGSKCIYTIHTGLPKSMGARTGKDKKVRKSFLKNKRLFWTRYFSHKNGIELSSANKTWLLTGLGMDITMITISYFMAVWKWLGSYICSEKRLDSDIFLVTKFWVKRILLKNDSKNNFGLRNLVKCFLVHINVGPIKNDTPL